MKFSQIKIFQFSSTKAAYEIYSVKSRLIPTRLIVASVVILFVSNPVFGLNYSFETCGEIEQNAVMTTSRPPCQTRETVVDLRPYVANLTDIVHLIPDVAIIPRCGGNCHRSQHRCIPFSKKTKRIPVMMVMSRYPQGIHDTLCGHIDVDEHLDCGCDCPIAPDDCKRARIGDPTSQYVPNKHFDSGSCRCVCRNTDERHRCILSGMEWDDSTCRCRCPLSRWQHCSTGYVFDYENSCNCVPTSMTASLGLIAAIIVLIVCILVTAVGFYTMYRRQIGLFKNIRRERIVRENQRIQIEDMNEAKPMNPYKATVATEVVSEKNQNPVV